MLPLLVAACGAWHGLVAGTYDGQVMHNGAMHEVQTVIEATPQGLAGRYVVREPTSDLPGKLEPLGDESCDTALFRWSDRYGTGLLRLRFLPHRRCFEGAWGGALISASLPYTSCIKAPVTS